MSNEIAGLGIQIDTGPVAKAVIDLDRLTAAAAKTEEAAGRAGSAWSAASKKVATDVGTIVAELQALSASQSAQATLASQMATSFGKLSKSMASASTAAGNLAQGSGGAVAALQSQAVAANSATAALTALASAQSAAGKQPRAYTIKVPTAVSTGAAAGGTASAAALQGVAAQSAAAAAALQAAGAASTAAGAAAGGAAPAFTKLGASAQKAGITAGQTAQAFRTLPAQFTDIVTSLAGGQSPFLVLIQQGGQIKDSFGGIGPALRAVTSLITPFRLAVGGAAAAAAALAYAYSEGASESAKFATSIALTGNAAGITEGQFNAMAVKIADATRTTIGSTRDTLQSLFSSGKFTSATLEGAAIAAQNLGKVTGRSSEEIIKSFVGAADGVYKFAQTSNNQYHYLTATQLDYIKTLEEQGDSQRALEIVLNNLNGRLDVAAGKVSVLGQAWQGVKNAVSGAIDELLKIGRVKTPEDALSDLNKQLDYLNKFGGTNDRKQEIKDQIEGQSEILRLQGRSAAAAARRVQIQQTESAFNAMQEKVQTRAAQRETEVAKARALGAKALADGSKTQAEVNKLIADTEAKYKDPKGAKPKDTTRVDARAQLLLQIEDLKSAGQAMVDQVNNTEKILEARRSSGAVSEADYYAQKKKLLQESTAAQVDALNQENALLAAQKLNTKDGLDRDRQVLKNKAEIAKLQGSEATGLTVLTIQQTGAINGLQVALLSARQAAEDYFKTVNDGYSRELAGIGQGDRNRNFEAALQQINEKYQQQRTDLANRRSQAELQAGGTLTAEARQQYDEQFKIIQEFQAKAITSYQNYYGKISDAQKDWTNGAREALANYFDESQNAAKQAETAGTNALKGLEDALVEISATGKLSFKSLADSIIKDLARIAVKQNVTGPLSSALSGLLGGLFKYSGSSSNPSAANYENQMDRGRFAKGGVMSMPSLSAYSNTIVSKPTFFAKGGNVMGEAGPEAIMPLRRGPDGKLGVAGGAGGNTIIHNYAGVQVETGQEQNAQGGIDQTIIIRQLEEAIGQNIAAGSGAIHRAMKNRFGVKTSTR